MERSPFPRLCTLLLATAIVYGSSAFAADLPAPVVQPGDTWTYRHIDGYNKLVVGTVSLAVAAAGAGDIQLVTRSGDGRYTSQSTYAGQGRLAAGTLSERAEGTLNPPLELARYPLREGEKWRQTVVRDDVLSREKRATALEAKVVGWQTVKVPAGEFRALLVERRIDLGDYDPFRGPTLRWEREWYAPEVKGTVKYEVFEEYFENRYSRAQSPLPSTRAIYELVSYKPG